MFFHITYIVKLTSATTILNVPFYVEPKYIQLILVLILLTPNSYNLANLVSNHIPGTKFNGKHNYTYVAENNRL